MLVRSVGLATDLMFAAWDGVVEDHPDHRVIRSPRQPDYYFGNFILVPDAPAAGDLERWMARFEAAFGADPRIAHRLFRWDRPDGAEGELAPFLAAGFVVDRDVVLTAQSVRPPPRPNRAVRLRALDGDADWEAATRLQVAKSVEMHGAPPSFARDLMARNRRFVAAGHGRWFGAFDGAELVADLGVFVSDGLARFQMVETAPAHRGRGICGTLVHHAAEAALRELGAQTLVLLADPGYHAARIYQALGFAPAERLVALMKPASPRAAGS